jgi:GLPGLI family protein
MSQSTFTGSAMYNLFVYKQTEVERNEYSKSELVTYLLDFNRNESNYTPLQNILPSLSKNGEVIISTEGIDGVLYTNIANSEYLKEKEFLGKNFIIKDTLSKLKWVLSDETKKIGPYLCNKATVLIEDKEKLFFNNISNSVKSNILDEFDIDTGVLVTAWYTTEIPIPLGPDEFWGLPGLILEVNDQRRVILCSKVTLRINDKQKIKLPSKGEMVSKAQYDMIVLRKIKEMN